LIGGRTPRIGEARVPPTTLDRLPLGGRSVIREVAGEGALVQRLMEMGLLDGQTVEVIGVAPLGDPIEIQLGDYRLSLRRSEAARVRIEPLP
jgi:ferrous iron transport protein A